MPRDLDLNFFNRSEIIDDFYPMMITFYHFLVVLAHNTWELSISGFKLVDFIEKS